jgi:hypothetical protein
VGGGGATAGADDRGRMRRRNRPRRSALWGQYPGL